MADIKLTKITPELPKVLPGQQFNLYAPVASKDNFGMVKFGKSSDGQNYIVSENGIISINLSLLKKYVEGEIADEVATATKKATAAAASATEASNSATAAATSATAAKASATSAEKASKDSETHKLAANTAKEAAKTEADRSASNADRSASNADRAFSYSEEAKSLVKAASDKFIEDAYLEEYNLMLELANGIVKNLGNVRGEQGEKGEKGEKGDPLTILKVYSSVTEMNSDFNNPSVPLHGLVIINKNDVEDEDNAKMYIKKSSGFSYVADLSGSKGIQGPVGPIGPQGVQGPIGPQGRPGLTPYIGQNGNWWIGDDDSGVGASGGTQASVISFKNSVFDLADEDDWSSDSVTNHSYQFKLFEYNRSAPFTNIDAYVRIGVKDTSGNTNHYRYAFNASYPFVRPSIQARTTAIPLRMFVENESNKDFVTSVVFYEKLKYDSIVEYWAQILTKNSTIEPYYATLTVNEYAGALTNVEIVKQTYKPYAPASGYDSLTITTTDWANKTAVINVSSRARAEGATASGESCYADGMYSDAGGNAVKVTGEASFGRGKSYANNAAYSGSFGLNHKLLNGDKSLVSGEGHINDAPISLISGYKNYSWRLSSGNNAVFGHTCLNYADHCLIHGYLNINGWKETKDSSGNIINLGKNRNDEALTGTKQGYSYVTLLGSYLVSGKSNQAVIGKWNDVDSGAVLVVADGSKGNPYNVLTVRKGDPTKDSDAITYGYVKKTYTTTTDMKTYVENILLTGEW